ncbi:MAG: transcriptional regulator MntR [Thermaerobacterales bacterium]
MAEPTTSMEDYLETIYELIEDKGYARVSDIASALDLQPSSVTRMIQRLDEQDFVVYERYRGLILTGKGEDVGRAMRRRHRTLEKFLRLIGVDDEQTVQEDVEGIEHHVSRRTIECIRQLVDFAVERPEWFEDFSEHHHRSRNSETGAVPPDSPRHPG